MTADRIAARLAEGPLRQATDEEALQLAIHNLMRAGFGTEDIAHKLGCALALVEEERDLLRAEGRLDALYTGRLAEPVEVTAPGIMQPVVARSPEERRAAFLRRIAQDLAWVLKAKAQMRAKGLSSARKQCPHCGGMVRLALSGSRNHVHAACETPSCFSVIE